MEETGRLASGRQASPFSRTHHTTSGTNLPNLSVTSVIFCEPKSQTRTHCAATDCEFFCETVTNPSFSLCVSKPFYLSAAQRHMSAKYFLFSYICLTGGSQKSQSHRKCCFFMAKGQHPQHQSQTGASGRCNQRIVRHRDTSFLCTPLRQPRYVLCSSSDQAEPSG